MNTKVQFFCGDCDLDFFFRLPVQDGARISGHFGTVWIEHDPQQRAVEMTYETGLIIIIALV